MADPTNPATAAGATQPDLGAQLATLTGVVTALAESQKSVMGAVEKLAGAAQQPAPAAAAPAAGRDGKPLSVADEVTRIVDERLKAFQQSSQQGQQRQQYQDGKLKDLPAAYRNQLGSDPAKWAAEEQVIRDQYKADFGAAGGTTPNVGGDNPGGVKPAAAVDVSKLSPVQRIEMGINASRPQRDGGAAAGTTTTAAGAAAAR